MHEKERHRIILSAVQDRPVVTVAELVRADRRLRGDDPPRHRHAAPAEAPAPGARRGRGASPAAVRRPCRAPLRRQPDGAACRGETGHRPRGGGALRGRRARSSSTAAPPPSRWSIRWRRGGCRSSPTPSRSPSTCSSTRRTPSCCPGARSTASRTSCCRPSRTTSPATSTPGACSWARRDWGTLGLMEADPLLIQAEQKLIDQADELVVLVDSARSSAAAPASCSARSRGSTP